MIHKNKYSERLLALIVSQFSKGIFLYAQNMQVDSSNYYQEVLPKSLARDIYIKSIQFVGNKKVARSISLCYTQSIRVINC